MFAAAPLAVILLLSVLAKSQDLDGAEDILPPTVPAPPSMPAARCGERDLASFLRRGFSEQAGPAFRPSSKVGEYVRRRSPWAATSDVGPTDFQA
jgi:hypothetical protein